MSSVLPKSSLRPLLGTQSQVNLRGVWGATAPNPAVDGPWSFPPNTLNNDQLCSGSCKISGQMWWMHSATLKSIHSALPGVSQRRICHVVNIFVPKSRGSRENVPKFHLVYLVFFFNFHTFRNITKAQLFPHLNDTHLSVFFPLNTGIPLLWHDILADADNMSYETHVNYGINWGMLWLWSWLKWLYIKTVFIFIGDLHLPLCMFLAYQKNAAN